MFVLAVVIEPDEDDGWWKCCGSGSVRLFYSECLVGSRPRRGSPAEIEARIFPHLDDKTDVIEHPYRFVSDGFRAVVTLGTTGASWFDTAAGEYWAASVDDLTEEGRKVVEGLKALYGLDVELLTFLDT